MDPSSVAARLRGVLV
ncbi:hypothetical protein Taro_035853 [Colocasia esculenta]|uniref:Uncharacterized protein n=1 Tax=Colocasia esculenta TaxID=4460 RepID=A0A843W7X9_COLES|nr:hypothetical protein [Colocasia esculenta]